MRNIKNKRKICFIITSFIHYSRNFLILDELEKRKDVELHIVIGGSALISKYISKFANIEDILKRDGHKNIHKVYFNFEGSIPVVKAKTTGVGIMEFSSVFNEIKPDLVIVRGDRFEILAVAIAAVYMNIPVAHIEGGDISGTVDESVRHAVTKLSHIHFPTNDDAEKRVISMGEDPKFVYNFGSPDVEVVKTISGGNGLDMDLTGSGAEHIDVNSDYMMVMFHPVSTDIDNLEKHTSALLHAIKEVNMPTFWFWPNSDAGADEISRTIREFTDKNRDHKIKFLRYLPPRKFLSLLKNTKCLIGNSSAGIKECSVLGIPVVDVGLRQDSRLKADNVKSVIFNKNKIISTIKEQILKDKYPESDLYYKKNTAKNISKVLAESELYIQKKFYN